MWFVLLHHSVADGLLQTPCSFLHSALTLRRSAFPDTPRWRIAPFRARQVVNLRSSSNDEGGSEDYDFQAIFKKRATEIQKERPQSLDSNSRTVEQPYSSKTAAEKAKLVGQSLLGVLGFYAFFQIFVAAGIYGANQIAISNAADIIVQPDVDAPTICFIKENCE